MPPSNIAAWLPAKSVKPLQVGPAPYTPPGAGQIVVKNAAVAINPVDWAKQLLGDALLGYIRYPFILGNDVAGEVVEVGPGVQRFRVGDRVVGEAVAGAPASNNPAEGAFQQYMVVREYLAAAIPDWLSYEQACVLPLGLSTAAYGLFHADFLALDPPTVPPPPTPSDDRRKKVIIITGGASSVGSCAVQLAVSAGYQVYSTASPKNFAYVERLGATRVFDYHSTSLVDDMVAELQGRTLAGAYAIGNGAVDACVKVLRRCGGGGTRSKKFVAFAGGSIPGDRLSTYLGMAAVMGSLVWSTARTAVTSRLAGVQVKFIDTKDLLEPDGAVARLVWREFLPHALAARQFVAAPEPLVVGTGLDKIQEALDIQKKGVSAQKIVVSL